jgi:uncharacterized protein
LDTLTILWLAGSIFVAALLYSSVGHGGASGYLAAMALFGVAPTVMKPTALVLNILVASIVTVKLYRAGWFSWAIFWPFAVASIPCSFLGGGITLPSILYKPLVGCVLIYAACRLLIITQTHQPIQEKQISRPIAFASGGVIGFLSGLTGVGGGIFLSPLLLLRGWAQPKTTAAVSGAFILVNSIAALLGHISSVKSVPSAIPVWAIAAMAGGYLGVEYGSKRLGNVALNRLLAVVLVIAGLKMVFT